MFPDIWRFCSKITSQRGLSYGTDEDHKGYIVTVRVPEGSAWTSCYGMSCTYNGVLALSVSGYNCGIADGVVVVVTAKHLGDVEIYTTETLKVELRP